MVPTAAVICANYDNYDSFKGTCGQSLDDVDWVYVTDNEAIGRGDVDPQGWRIVFEPRPGMHPNRAAKFPKCLPAEYTDAPCSVWVDASFQVVSDQFVTEALAWADPIAQFRHPERSCIYAEAQASAYAKYHGEPITEQVGHYLEAGHPQNWGLWATGVIARHHTPEVVAFGLAWLDEIDRWSFQDQLSEPFALRESGLRPTDFPGRHLATPWLSYQGSGRH